MFGIFVAGCNEVNVTDGLIVVQSRLSLDGTMHCKLKYFTYGRTSPHLIDVIDSFGRYQVGDVVYLIPRQEKEEVLDTDVYKLANYSDTVSGLDTTRPVLYINKRIKKTIRK